MGRVRISSVKNLTKTHLRTILGNRELEEVEMRTPQSQQTLYNAAAIRVQKSMALNPVRGNCARKKRLFPEQLQVIDDTPLPKRKRN